MLRYWQHLRKWKGTWPAWHIISPVHLWVLLWPLVFTVVTHLLTKAEWPTVFSWFKFPVTSPTFSTDTSQQVLNISLGLCWADRCVIFADFQPTRQRSPSDSLQSSNFSPISENKTRWSSKLSSCLSPTPKGSVCALCLGGKQKKEESLGTSVYEDFTDWLGSSENHLWMSVLELWLLKRRDTDEVNNELFF